MRTMLLITLATMLMLTPHTWADDKDQTVAVQVWVIRATTSNSTISPELKGIAGSLKQKFKYTGFKLERKTGKSVKLNQAIKLKLLDAYSAKITPTRKDSKNVTLALEFFKGSSRLQRAGVTFQRGRFQLFGGWKLNAKDALIVAVAGK